MTNDELVIAKIEDKIEQCLDGYYITSTSLLDSHEQALAKAVVRRHAGIRTLMYGGYEDAERRMLICIPADYQISDDEAKEGLLEVLRATKPGMSRSLTHRDYLGSILGLGIERRLIGDILVREDGADIFIVPEIAGFLMNEYHMAGRTELKTSLISVDRVMIPETRAEIINDTVSSARLDSIISSAFRISRSRSAEAIKRGLVSVNHEETLKPDKMISEGDSLVLKGKGKAVVEEIGGESRKGRVYIRIRKMI